MFHGYIGAFALLCLLVGGAACAAARRGGADATPPLDCTMSAPPRVRAGEPVRLRFRLTNRTERRLSVLTWQTPLEGLFGRYLHVTRDGVDIPYQGPQVKRGDPEAEEYLAIAPGASAEDEVEVSLAYDMKQPGRYRIAFSGLLLDVAEGGASTPRPLARHRAVSVRCPVVETIVTP